LRAYPVPDGQGGVSALVEFGQDITQRKRGEEETARLQAQIHQAQKLESIGRLAGGVAHDLNNLLSPVLGYGEMLLDWAGGDDPRTGPLEEIIKAARRARDLIRQLLAFSRKQLLEFRTIDVYALLLDFERLLRRTIREDIAIHMHLSEALPFVEGDAGQLEQVIMNLAINAQDAMPDGGHLSFETALVELDGEYAAQNTACAATHVMLRVSDTGCGMDENTRAQIFEPFFTTKEKDRGTGLGLATVYGIVKQHGGHIWVESGENRGTSFTIYLPVSSSPSAEEALQDPKPAAGGGSETVLLVEDDEQVRHLALALLQREGYEVVSAKNGKEALEVTEKHDGPIHLVLTDVVMPGMNGKELFERIAARFPQAKPLFMSGYTENVIAHRGVIDQGVRFIQKPFSIKALCSKVRQALDQNA
jgi:signal transduction histidine kinase/CheY-like chemotaxis protein